MMERAVALAGAPMIGLGDLPSAVAGLSASPAPLLAQLPPDGCALDEVIGEVERRLILQALERTGGVRKAAAKLLGVSFRSLRYRLAKHALAADGDGEDDPEGGSRRESSPPGALQ
jgi:two-component system, NtrC family, response regulator PilR